jgi:hypothetical protein
MISRPSVSQNSASSPSIDFASLDRDGYVVLPGLVPAADLAEFERCIEIAGTRLAAARSVAVEGGEPLAAVIKASGKHRSMLFDHVKRLWLIERLTGEIGRWLETQGLFAHSKIEVPVLWPTLKADLPGETEYSFPLHQDYATTRSRTAWRLWIPLRDANRERGSMRVAVGSHRQGPYRYVGLNTTYPHVAEDELARHGFELIALDVTAGTGVLFDPRMVHGSVPNRSAVTKYVMLLHLQDLASFPDPSNPDDPMRQFLDLSDAKQAAERKARS